MAWLNYLSMDYHLLVLCEVFVDISHFYVPSFTILSKYLECSLWVLVVTWLGFCLFYIFEVGRHKLHVFPHIIREIWRPDWRIKLLQTNLQTVEESRIRSVMIIFSSGLQFRISNVYIPKTKRSKFLEQRSIRLTYSRTCSNSLKVLQNTTKQKTESERGW